MYKERYDVIPLKFWILNGGDVNILPLDMAQELIEGEQLGAAQVSSAASKTTMNSDTLFEQNNSDSIKEQYHETESHDCLYRHPGGSQLLLELPDHLGLILFFSRPKEAEEFYRKIHNAIRFQVILVMWFLTYTSRKKCCYQYIQI